MDSSIHFFSEDIPFKLLHPRKTSLWIKKVIAREKAKLGKLNYVFCSDEFLLSLNIKYLNHRTLTDIITFDMSEKERTVHGDIYISIDRVSCNSNELNIEFADELDRVMIHGVLHLVGYKDKSPKEKKVMREKEDSCLSLRPN